MTADQASVPAAGDSRAVSAFVAKLRGSYDVSETILFGSRARGDNRPDSDLDLAVVLNGKRGDFIDTKLDMAGLAFDVLMETGVLVQAFPMWEGAFPQSGPHPEYRAGRHTARMTQPVMDKALKALASARILLAAGDTEARLIAPITRCSTRRSPPCPGRAKDAMQPKTHGGLIASFGQNLVRTDKLPSEFGRALNRVQELRLTADYLAEPVPIDKAEWAIKEAAGFVAAISGLLLQPKPIAGTRHTGRSANSKMRLQ